MPYFEFMMLIDDWIDEIEEEKKNEKKRKDEAEKERKNMESTQRKSSYKTPSMPKSMNPKFR